MFNIEFATMKMVNFKFYHASHEVSHKKNTIWKIMNYFLKNVCSIFTQKSQMFNILRKNLYL